MVKQVKTITRSEAIFSDDDKHRLYLKKIWNSKLPIATVITKFPRYEGQITSDLTTQLIVNNIYDRGLGGCIIVNLFTHVDIANNADEVEELLHEEADKYILDAAKGCDEIIFAWGASSSKIISQRIKEVESLMIDYTEKTGRLINPTTKKLTHPLNPKSRQFWVIEKLQNIEEDK